MQPVLWEIDVYNYDENLDLLIQCKDNITNALKKENALISVSDTLVSKIMLGVFANVPAFDTFFKKSNIGVKKFDANSLLIIKDYYNSHKSDFDSFHIPTINFSGQNTDNEYTIAKLVDMYGFIDGKMEHNRIL
ncbi:MAG: hypothetical protein ACLQG5_03875 [Methanobacterium sp.]|jgi:hypothetical protein